MKKIAFITTHAPSLVHFRGKLIESLRLCGFEVLAFAPNHDAATRGWLINIGAVPVDCSLSRTGLNPFNDFLSAIALAKILRRSKPDIVFSYFVKPVIFGTIAGWLAGVPRRLAMIEGLGFVFSESDIKKKSLRMRLLKFCVVLLYRISLTLADKVIFLNKDDALELVELNVLKKEKVFYLGGIGVDLNSWRQSVPPVQQAVFILVARLLREKGVLYYAAAAKHLKKEYPAVRFLLLGDLDQNPGSITLDEVKGWVDEGILEWFGHVPVKPFLDISSVFVLPSYYREGVPLSIQEALAVGRAVITTDSPGCRETVIDGLNGFLVSTHDVKQLIERMRILINSPTLVCSMGKESRNIAVRKFDVLNKTRDLLQLIAR